jgi:hypothetical protein
VIFFEDLSILIPDKDSEKNLEASKFNKELKGSGSGRCELP